MFSPTHTGVECIETGDFRVQISVSCSVADKTVHPHHSFAWATTLLVLCEAATTRATSERCGEAPQKKLWPQPFSLAGYLAKKSKHRFSSSHLFPGQGTEEVCPNAAPPEGSAAEGRCTEPKRTEGSEEATATSQPRPDCSPQRGSGAAETLVPKQPRRSRKGTVRPQAGLAGLTPPGAAPCPPRRRRPGGTLEQTGRSHPRARPPWAGRRAARRLLLPSVAVCDGARSGWGGLALLRPGCQR